MRESIRCGSGLEPGAKPAIVCTLLKAHMLTCMASLSAFDALVFCAELTSACKHPCSYLFMRMLMQSRLQPSKLGFTRAWNHCFATNKYLGHCTIEKVDPGSVLRAAGVAEQGTLRLEC